MEKHKVKSKVSRLLFMLVIGTFFLSPVNAIAKRTVKGTITDKNGNPAANVRVKAFDDDWPDADDLMAPAVTTNESGYYEIHYKAKHYDKAPHGWTIWRPDIYIRVSAPVNGRCDDGSWKPEKKWKRLMPDSSVTENHPHRKTLVKNLKIRNYPFNVAKQQFVLREDMWCASWPLHTNCFGCADNGDKVEWTEWGVEGVPKVRTRCWTHSNKKCTKSDYENILSAGKRVEDSPKQSGEVLPLPPHQPKKKSPSD